MIIETFKGQIELISSNCGSFTDTKCDQVNFMQILELKMIPLMTYVLKSFAQNECLFNLGQSIFTLIWYKFYFAKVQKINAFDQEV